MDKNTVSRVRERWREAVTDGETGFTAVPDILIRSQSQLRLSPTEMVVLLNILLHWWQADSWPYPRLSAISSRMGVSQRTVERTVRSLQEKGLLVHLPSDVVGDGPFKRRFDLSGLIHVLQAKAKERAAFRTVESDNA